MTYLPSRWTLTVDTAVCDIKRENSSAYLISGLHATAVTEVKQKNRFCRSRSTETITLDHNHLTIRYFIWILNKFSLLFRLKWKSIVHSCYFIEYILNFFFMFSKFCSTGAFGGLQFYSCRVRLRRRPAE